MEEIAQQSPNASCVKASEKDSVIESKEKNLTAVKYKVYWYRFVVLFLYCIANFIFGILWTTFMPIAGIVQTIYNIDINLVNMVALLFMIWYSPISILSNYVTDQYGLRIGCVLGLILSILGSWIRCLINSSFAAILVGQSLCAIGQPFIYGSPAKVAAYWFSEDGRALATTIGNVANLLGCSIGYIIPSIFVGDNSNSNDIYNLLLCEALMTTIVSIVFIAAFKDKPDTPPCAAAAVEKQAGFVEGLCIIVKNKNYLWLLISGATVMANMYTYSTILYQILAPFGFSSDDVGIIGMIFNLAGVVGAMLIGKILDWWKRYNLVFVALQIANTLFTVLFLPSLHFSANYALIVVLNCLIGCAFVAITPVTLDFACEITFPCGEALSSGLIIAISSIISIAQVFICGVFVDYIGEGPSMDSLYLLTGFGVLATIASFLVEEKLLRLAF